eukprot:TRINITY_DN5227_c0_g1_i1.p1 TRINITY_DN5227_c0_g1~~TRINITY_DN5227_c0_g1_i1.p1  ORF type:complete len:183 (+),score=52.03 TRINITY_DN5227_c0_g1_i1:112-660(+)
MVFTSAKTGYGIVEGSEDFISDEDGMLLCHRILQFCEKQGVVSAENEVLPSNIHTAAAPVTMASAVPSRAENLPVEPTAVETAAQAAVQAAALATARALKATEEAATAEAAAQAAVQAAARAAEQAAALAAEQALKASEEAAAQACLLYTSDAADEEDSVDLGGRRILKKKNTKTRIDRIQL